MRIFGSHTKAIFQIQKSEPVPWPRMVICSLATGGPLIFGILNDQLSVAIYAALFGYMVALNDHLGEVRHRVFVVTLSFFILAGSFFLGVNLREHVFVFTAVVLALTYCCGVMGGLGAELERLILFSIIQILVGFYGGRIPAEGLYRLASYGLLSYCILVLGALVSNYFMRSKTLEFATLKMSFLQLWTLNRRSHLYAMSFTATMLLAIFCVQYLGLKRGYWTIITVLLIMKPDRQESIYRSFQRFLGTLAGVGLGEGVLLLKPDIIWLIVGTMFSAFLVPNALKRNYWMASFFVSLVVIFLLSIPSFGHFDVQLPFLRLEATFYGCLLSLAGVLIFKMIETSASKWS